MTKVLMYPHPNRIKDKTNGIAQVVLNYGRYAPQFDIEYVTEDKSYDVVAVHAGMQQTTEKENLVCHCHGLYWTADRPGQPWEFEANKNVIQSIRNAKEITVPSDWVAQTIRRDMHISPHVVPHGINWQEWQHNEEDLGYILYNKNRETTTCNSSDVGFLASNLPAVQFVTTFGDAFQNVSVTGVMPFRDMRKTIQQCSVYLATVKETGGIGIMEAMASGKPILGYRRGVIVDLVEHGVNGYLAEGREDLIDGLLYCIEHRDVLGHNSRELARRYTWERAVEQLSEIYRQATHEQEPTVSIVIPCYNYAPVVSRAIRCAVGQSYPFIEKIVVVDDGSTDETQEVVSSLALQDNRIVYIRQDNAGVAHARNNGISYCKSKYICCLDADDQILPGFISACVPVLEKDRSVGIAYTKLKLTNRQGTKVTKKASEWPGEFDYDSQVGGRNQIPTCCVFRRSAWERLGGYRQRYAPKGAGSEDAAFWLAVGSIGYDAKLASTNPHFIYTLGGGGTTGDPSYVEIDWLYWHPWTRDGQHPFASVATPDKKSHPVRAYDEPIVSVIVPVGPGHEENAINALDSIEGQSFRKWELICVWDSKDLSMLQYYKDAFPFAKWVETGGGMGAGYARNRGVEVASADLIDFLDADDWFYPLMLQNKLEVYQEMGGDVAVYTDSVGKAQLSQDTVKKAKPGKILFYDPNTQEAVISQKNLPYDWNRAIKQPDEKAMYIWCYISTLHPKKWWEEVGGLDEKMISWEDWDYWLRLAFLGKCFVHLEQELMVYPYYTGGRREKGRQEWTTLISYMREKYKVMEKMPCKGCGQSKRRPSPITTAPTRRASPIAPATSERNVAMFSFEEDMVLIDYITTQRGDHPVIGHAKFDFRLPGLRMVNISGRYQIDYGYRAGGDRFLVHKDEIIYAPHLFKPVSTSIPEITITSQASTRKNPPPQPVRVQRILEQELNEEDIVPMQRPKKIDEQFDLQSLPGISSDIERQLKEMGVDTPEDVLAIGVDGLKELKGIGPQRASVIFAALQKRLSE